MAVFFAAGLARAQVSPPPASPTYHAARDFSITKNPNGPWSYGYSSSATATDFKLYADAKKTLPPHPRLEGWCGNAGSDGTPFVWHNKSLGTIRYWTSVFPPECLSLHPGPQGQRSIVRFTAPSRAWYIVQGNFSALDKATTDPHVLVNGKELPGIGPVDHTHKRQEFEFVEQLEKGDTVDFAVGSGEGGYANDSTGLEVTIRSSPVRPSVTARPPPLPALPPLGPNRKPSGESSALAGLKGQYDRRFQGLAADGEARTKRLKAEYLVSLEHARQTATTQGDLESVLAVKAEIERTSKGTATTETDKKTMPPGLLECRKQYETELSRLLEELKQQQTALQKQYLEDLTTLQRQLTQRGDIAGAVAVKEERERIQAALAP